MSCVVFFLFFLFLKYSVICDPNECNKKEKCGECLQELGCAWCSEFSLSKIHCFDEKIISNKCPAPAIFAKSEPPIIIKDEPLIGESNNNNPVQIRPQIVKLKLRKGEEFKLKFDISLAKNVPIDLYYLMDLSASMLPYKDNLANLGSSLVAAMRNLTSDFKLGFGSFVDKVAMPFASTLHERLENPCTDKPCAPAYSFINHLKLSNGSNFAELVNSSKVSGNVDHPEGGLDALMQVMLCSAEIGWRNQARRIIVFSTDAPFHIAGDGKLAGIIEPNDAKCHMKDNKYTHSLIFDYPSISLVKYVAKEENFKIFFTIVENTEVLNLYRILSSEIENSQVGILNEKSDITELIKVFHENTENTFKIRDENSEGVEIKYKSDHKSCKSGNECTKITFGEVMNFEAIIKATSCNNPRKEIYIKTDAFHENLLVNLEIICDCDCEHENNNQISDNCNKNGQEKCGVCLCNKGFIGDTCECKENDIDSGSNRTCINGDDTEVCSGMGECKCGNCKCEKRSNPEEIISGKFCECDNYSCLKSVDQKLCGGNGICKCGKCECHPGWKDESCSCSTQNDLCTHNDVVCNNKGKCDCGECICENGYFGRYCEDCPTCSKCDDLKWCVECKVLELTTANCSDCTISVNKIETIEDVDDDKTKVCRFQSKDDCFLIFKYNYNDLSTIEAETNLRCSKPVNIYAVVFGLIGGILLIGLLTLILWRIYMEFIDRREYAKFLNEEKNAKWHTEINPLFKSAVSNFQNPTYGRQSIITKRKKEGE